MKTNMFKLLLVLGFITFILHDSSAVVTNTSTKTVTALGNGSTTNYTIGFTFQSNSDILVWRQEESSSPYTRTVIQQGSGASKFTITGGNPGTTVVMGTAPSATQRLIIKRSTPHTQTVDYVETDAFPAEDHEKAMDKGMLVLQELQSDVDTKVGLSTASTATTPVFPDLLSNRFLAYNSTDLTLLPSSGPTSGDVLKYDGATWSKYALDSKLSALDAADAARVLTSDFTAHTTNYNNPHQVTSNQLGANNIIGTINNGTQNIDWVRVNKSGSNISDLAAKSHTSLSDIGTNTHAQIDSHIANTSNPHNVTAAQVGNTTAQWNANKIQGKTVDTAAIGDGKLLTYQAAGDKIVYSSVSALPALGAANTVLNVNSGGTDVEYDKIVDANIASGAAITRSKTASGTAYRVLVNNSSGVMSENAALLGSSVVTTDANGQLVASGFSSIDPLTVRGDIIVQNSVGVADRLGIGGASTFLKSNGSDPVWSSVNVGSSDITGILPVANGGTSTVSLAQYGVLVGGGAAAVQAIAPDASTTKVLTSGGLTGNPTWQAASSSPDSSYELSNVGLAASIGSSTLIVALTQANGSDCAAGTAACKIGFRNATLATGQYSQTSLTSANSITLGTSDSLGRSTVSTDYLQAYVVNDGVSEICLSTAFLDDGLLTSASALTGGADTTAGTLWCTSAHTLRPIRHVGRVKATFSTPNWSNVSEVSLTPVSRAPRSYIRLDTQNGLGSDDTAIDRFTNVRAYAGTAITYTDSSLSGATFTINEPGVYTISWTRGPSVSGNAQTYMGFTLNEAPGLSRDDVWSNVADTERLAGFTLDNPVSVGQNTVNWAGFLTTGDVIRCHSQPVNANTPSKSLFSMAKVSN